MLRWLEANGYHVSYSSAIDTDRRGAELLDEQTAAMLARRMGASDRHAVMAAGLAGGIGLSGGACGALGAAIWIDAMRVVEEGGKVPFKSPRALDAIGRFLKCTGYEFECSQIAGRKFESIADHAGHLRGGGCARVLDVLAASQS